MNPSTYYHVYTHANGSENLFRVEENYHFFLKKYALHINPIADTFAYCLMPNHIHFLIRIKSEEELKAVFKNQDLLKQSENDGSEKYFQKFETFGKLELRISKQFANLFSSYTQSYNKVFDRKGSLFIPNFKKKPVETESYFTKLIHYIHANPVHHGFVKNIDDWKFSSYHSIISSQPSNLKREEVLFWFHGKEDFIKFHQQVIDLKLMIDF